MEQPPLLLILFTTMLASFSTNPASAASPADFIRRSCMATSYPDVCVRSLATYAPAVHRSPRQLAHAAITVSANRAHDASAYLSWGLSLAAQGKSVRRGRGASSLMECIVAMTDSTNRLRKSVEQLRRLGRARSRRFVRHINSVQTWISAALTDQSTCLSSLSQDGSGAGGAAIRKKVVEASRVTSNALSLVNGIASWN